MLGSWRPFIIPEPRLGMLNLAGSATVPLAETDSQALSPLFSSTTRSTDRVPECDVLLVYVNLDHDGVLTDCNYTLEEIIAMSRAPIAIVASVNSVDSYIGATRWLNFPGSGTPSVNLVMTIDRRGSAFAQFFGQLFTHMKHGVTMPKAWMTLASQASDADHDAPETICVMAAGHVAFARRPSFFRRLFGR